MRGARKVGWENNWIVSCRAAVEDTIRGKTKDRLRIGTNTRQCVDSGEQISPHSGSGGTQARPSGEEGDGIQF